MKKLIVVIIFAFLMNLPTYSYIQPNGGINIDKWEHNKEVQIAWRFTIDTLAPTADSTIFEVVTIAKLDSVTIDLWDAKNSRYINIVTNYVDTNNVYNWTIPDSLDIGNHYKIKVSNANDSNFYQLSSNFFPIFEEPEPSPKPVFQTETKEDNHTFGIYPNPVKRQNNQHSFKKCECRNTIVKSDRYVWFNNI